jgi:hypothetical protein
MFPPETGGKTARVGVVLSELAARLQGRRKQPLRLPLAPEGLLAVAAGGWPLFVAGVAGLIGGLIYVRTPDVLRPIFDDSYITLHFARNLAEHGKLTFDGQDWSSGATSTLHVVILASLLKIGFAPFWATAALGVVSNVLLSLAVYWLGWAVFRERLAALAAAMLVSFTSYVAMDAGNGLETSLFLALVTATLAAFLSLTTPRGRLLTGVLMALAVLTRPEGLFLLPATALYLLIERDRTAPWRATLNDAVRLYGPPIVAFAGVTLMYAIVTGSLTPGTATAKLRFFQEYDWSLREKIRVSSHEFGLFIEPLMAHIVLAALVARRKETALFAFFWLPVYAMYVLLLPGGLEHYFYRYQHPVIPLLCVLAGGGIAYLVALARSRDWLVRAVIIGGLIVLAIPVWQQFELWRGYYHKANQEVVGSLEVMAKDLNTIVLPGESLATHDVGAVSYYADFKVIDLVGLANPEVVEYHDGRRLQEYIELEQPDYLLIFDQWDIWFLGLFAADRPNRFELVKVYPTLPSNFSLYRVSYPNR